MTTLHNPHAPSAINPKILFGSLFILVILLYPPRDFFTLHTDDYLIMSMLGASPAVFDELEKLKPADQIAQQVTSAFEFFSAKTGSTAQLLEYGALPWWTSPDSQMHMLRPLAALTHWVDFHVLDKNTLLIQLHSLIWFALLILTVAFFYAKHLPYRALIGLSAVLFLLDASHAFNINWLAARNAYMAPFFGMWAVYFHMQWRNQAKPYWLVLSLVTLLGALFAAEAGIACFGYFVAFAWIMDKSGFIKGSLATLPAATLIIVWRLIYNEMGYGSDNIGLYLDPGRSPLLFLENLAINYGLILFSIITGVDNLSPSLSAQAKTQFALAGFTLWLVFTWFARKLLTQHKALLFLFIACLIAAIPFCTISYNSSRVIPPLSIGFTPIFAALILQLWRAKQAAFKLFLARLSVCILLLPHAIAPAVLSVGISVGLVPVHEDKSKLAGNDGSNRSIAYASYPLATNGPLLPYVWSANNVNLPPSLFLLAPGINPYTLSRVSDTEFVAHSEFGFVVNQTIGLEPKEAIISQARRAYRFQQSMITDPKRVYESGQVLSSGPATVTITQVQNDQPVSLAIEFKQAAETMQWLYWDWDQSEFKDFVLPKIGESIVVSP